MVVTLDFNKFSQQISELEEQKQIIEQKIDTLKREQDNMLKEIAALHGYDLKPFSDKNKDLNITVRKRKPARIKYRDGQGNTWTGRGMTPVWVKEAEKNGQNRDVFLVPS